ncbi:N-ethylmaleimide reductase [Planctomycetes bacterium Poly30]|uniref:N-ethylmaleimide reductase n=1 Tax=Saltatorellus ferox TaxID=2528018 RepID=A0A518EY92_9BACT|nr:N-ethylmaleimide reductase [Planctomycetes bacterium Poly30]
MSPFVPKRLLEGFSLRGLPLSNRVAMAPMTRGRAGEGRVPGEKVGEYYAQRAGAGLVITEATSVSEQGNGWVDAPGIYTGAQEAGWKKVVEKVHGAGGKIFLQLWHTGRASHSSFHGGKAIVAPSAVKIEGEGVHTPEGKQAHEVPRALEVKELPGIVADYVQAAERAVRAGFDGVEVHSANGYLLDTFLQSKTNLRDDEYGGSVENRFRLLREIVTAISGKIGAEKVAVRLSPNGVFNDMGSPDFRETFLYAAGELNGFGLAYLHVMDGLAFGFHKLGEPVTLAETRKVFDGPLMGNCGYDAESAEKAVASGDADLIAIGRPYIANPDLVERYRNGWELADSDMSAWYGGGEDGAGYTDFPAHAEGATAQG